MPTKLVSFFGTVAAAATAVLVSRRISRAFFLRRLIVTFAPGCANLVLLRFYLAGDNQAPAAGPPSGISLLQDYGQVDYLAGDDEQKALYHQIEQRERGSYLKVYAVNGDTFAHSVNVQMEIALAEE